jgi:hypothetical protein
MSLEITNNVAYGFGFSKENEYDIVGAIFRR